MRRIGVLLPLAENDPEAQDRLMAFRQGLEKVGWAEGRNLRIEHRFAAGSSERMRAFAKELVGLKPDMILASGTPVLLALQHEASTIPIVFVMVHDPLGAGLVASLAHPGGNITGLTQMEFSTSAKWLELLKTVDSRVTRVAVIQSPEDPASAGYLREIEAVAQSFKVQLLTAGVHDAMEIERAISAFARQPNGALVVLPSPIATVHRERIIALAALHRLPAVYAYRFFAASGGLMSYGAEPAALYRQATSYVDRILKGANPADLPVQQPTELKRRSAQMRWSSKFTSVYAGCCKCLDSSPNGVSLNESNSGKPPRQAAASKSTTDWMALSARW
jgi:putative ABC transport system substrate-binding protein